MADVNHSLSKAKIKQFSRLFIACRGKSYAFILIIYGGLCRSAAMLLNEICTYQVTVPKSVVEV